MILLLTTMVAMAQTNTLANTPADTLVTHLKSRSYRQNGKLLVVSKDKVILSKLEGQNIPYETLPKLGDIDKEIARLQNKHGTTCVLNIAPQDPKVESVVSGYSITEMGACTVDDNIRYSIKDNGNLWTVVDNEGDEVSVHAFANVCEDLPLLLSLEHENNVARRNGKVLEWGATALGVAGLFTMGNPDPGFSAREQNRFWTSVFLFGTATMLYTQRDTPFVYMTDKQDDISNYHSRESVERILLKTFGLAPEEVEPQADEGLETETTDAAEEDAEQTERTAEDSSTPNTTTAQQTQDKTEPTESSTGTEQDSEAKQSLESEQTDVAPKGEATDVEPSTEEAP